MSSGKQDRQARQVTESATSRLSRLLTMVPWLLNRLGVEVEEAAREFAGPPGLHHR